MNIGFYSAVSGMSAYQKGIDVIAHNMANVSTVGFKPSTSAFSDLLYTEMDTNVEGEHLTGHGVKNFATDLRMGQGILNRTEVPTDFAIIGEGFFMIDRGGEEPEFTRDGSFTVGLVGKKAFLVTSEGDHVLDDRGKQIEIEFDDDTELPVLDDLQDRIGIYTFPNPYGLSRKEGSSFSKTPLSGEEKENREGCDLVQGGLEFSSVDMSDEMVNVLSTQKAFQFNAKLVQSADQIEEIVNNLR